MPIAGEVAIIGVGTTKFGENFEMSYFDQVVEAAYAAFADANVDPKDIQAGWLGTCYAFAYTTEGNAGTSLSEPLSMWDIPVTRVANYCATGMDAVRNAALAVAAGEYELVLALGCEKMRDVPPRGSLVAQHVEKGHPFYAKGRSAPGIFALLATRYAHHYGVDVKEAMAKVAVKNHYNGSLNPKAHFQREVTEEQVLNSPMICEPIGLLDACPTTDGAAAVILTSTELARKYTNDYVVIKGIGLSVSNGFFSAQFAQDWDFVGVPATRAAAAMAYKAAGISDPAKQIKVAEVHDCFTITEILDYEDLGFAEPGKGHLFIKEGHSALDGKLPVNTSGGLKSCGHPIGGTGVRMISEIANQIRGRGGKRQVKDVDVGLAHTLGGPGSVACVTVLGRP